MADESFSVEKPESATVLPVELPSGDFRCRRGPPGRWSRLPLAVRFHEEVMSSEEASC